MVAKRLVCPWITCSPVSRYRQSPLCYYWQNHLPFCLEEQVSLYQNISLNEPQWSRRSELSCFSTLNPFKINWIKPIPVPPKEYAFWCNPLMLLKNTVVSGPPLFPLDPIVTGIAQVYLASKKKNNIGDIRALFRRDVIPVPNVVFHWNNLISNLDWKKIWSLHFKCLITHKIREIIFKK